MKITILSLFPEMFKGPFDESIIKRAKEKKLVDIQFMNIRDFGIGRHKIVDDTPYGGGPGMILRVDVTAGAIENAKNPKLNKKEQKTYLLSPQGKVFDQKKAHELSKLKHLILVCGHYEGIDGRVDKFIDGKISIGDFIVTGGEIPAMLIVDAVVRLIKGTLKEGVTASESFSSYNIEHPQYTKPRIFKNLSVPEVLLSGNHKKIKEWKEKESIEITGKVRPDLLKKGK